MIVQHPKFDRNRHTFFYFLLHLLMVMVAHLGDNLTNL